MRPHRSLAAPTNVDELISRIGHLDPASRRQWGTMTPPHEMLCHLADSFLAVLAERPASSAKTLLSRTVIKWVALHTSLPWPRCRRGPKVNQKQGGTRPSEFERDRQAVILDLIQRFVCRRLNAVRTRFRRDDAGRVDAVGLR